MIGDIGWDMGDRYMDLLDLVSALSDDEDDDELPIGHRIPAVPRRSEETAHDILLWNTQCSIELQRVVDSFNLKELYDLNFSVSIADPKQHDCPLVACSSGFIDLTGYSLSEIAGRNCRFLLNGVARSCINDQSRFLARDFCNGVNKGIAFDRRSEVDRRVEMLLPGAKQCGFSLQKGQVICVQTNATKEGKFFKMMFFLKQAWLEDQPYIVGLQAEINEEDAVLEEDIFQELQSKCQYAWKRLGSNMTIIEQVLRATFRYSGTLGRQD